MKFLILLITFCVTLILTFAVTFTIITFYITKQKIVQPKYHFTGVPDTDVSSPSSTGIPNADVFRSLSPSSTCSSVDSESAQKEWKRKKNNQY